jgi:hypothetical protein
MSLARNPWPSTAATFIGINETKTNRFTPFNCYKKLHMNMKREREGENAYIDHDIPTVAEW